MTPRTPHPTLTDWMDWVHERLDDEGAERMERHQRNCSVCRSSAGMLELLRTARRMERWELPPEPLRARAARLPSEPRPPRRPRRFHELHWQPADVRGQTLVAAPEPASLNAVLATAELSVVATPPTADPFWSIEGRVWLRGQKASTVDVVLSREDHVIAHRTVTDGEFFRIREILPPGWELEVHLPDGGPVKLSDRGL